MVNEKLFPRFILGMIVVLLLSSFSGCVGSQTGSYKDSATQNVSEAKAKCTDYLAGKGARDVQMDSLCSDVKTIVKQDKQLGAAPTPTVTGVPASTTAIVTDTPAATFHGLPYDISKSKVHFSVEKKQFDPDDIYSDVIFGSCGDNKKDLCIAMKRTGNHPKATPEISLASMKSKYFINDTVAIAVHRDGLNKPEHLDAKFYKGEDGWQEVYLPGVAESMRTEKERFTYLELMSGESLDPALLD